MGRGPGLEPPNRLVLTWRIAGDWQLDEAASEIEVTFSAVGDGTRVKIEHRHFERLRLGDAMREQVGDEGGWGGLLGPTPRRSDAAGIAEDHVPSLSGVASMSSKWVTGASPNSRSLGLPVVEDQRLVAEALPRQVMRGAQPRHGP